MKDKDLIEVLWGLSLAEHLGDVSESIQPILKYFKLRRVGLRDLTGEMVKKGLIPDYAKEDYE